MKRTTGAAKARNTRLQFAKPFAVSKFEVTFDDWDACVAYGDCNPVVRDSGWGRGRQPVINVTWDDAQRYVAWLSRMTGRTYRLLSEAEWEYAARAGTQTAYSWGDEIGKGNANCHGCGSQWDRRQTAPVGSFAANAFGLYDMLGNVGNGSRIASITITAAHPRMARRGRQMVIVTSASFAAVPGSTIQNTSARPATAAPPPATGTTTWAFVSVGRFSREFSPGCHVCLWHIADMLPTLSMSALGGKADIPDLRSIARS